MVASVEPILNVENLSVSYGGCNPVTKCCSFAINAGEVVGLTGPSSSGKSTLGLALLGLTRATGSITDGSVYFKGRDILSLDEAALNEIRGAQIAYIQQNARAALHPMYSVGRQVGRAWQTHIGGSVPAATARAIEMLRLLGINDPESRADAFVHELSGGMAQRALIALALSSEPQILIADEPTSGLDVTVQAQFLDTMWQTSREKGTSMLLITQEPGILANYCDRVIELSEGCIQKDSAISAFLSRQSDGQPDVKDAEGCVDNHDASILYKVAGLRKTFPVRGSKKRLQAVHDLTLSIHRGESLGLVGESGSGKSTVGRCLLKLMDADAGELDFRATDKRGDAPSAKRPMRSRMQIVLQDPAESFDPRWTIGRTLQDAIRLHHKMTAAEAAIRIAELLNMVGLSKPILRKRPGELSAGVLQRLAIARALAPNPEFLVLDEPTSLIGPEDRRKLISLLNKLRASLDLAFLFISHDLTSIAAACDRVAVMYLGQIVELGDRNDVFSSPLHPYTQALVAAHLEEKPSVRRVEATTQDQLVGEIPSPIDLPSGCYLAGRCPAVVETCRRSPKSLVQHASGRLIRCDQLDVPPGPENRKASV